MRPCRSRSGGGWRSRCYRSWRLWTLRSFRRFKTEAQAAAQLHHTHVVPVYSVGCERGVHFYAMQLIDGQTLRKRFSLGGALI